MVESVFNFHERIYQTAYVGASKNGKTIPTLVFLVREVELTCKVLQLEKDEKFDDKLDQDIKRLSSEAKLDALIEKVLVYPGTLPVDPSHNSKIRRDVLAAWASTKI